MTDSTSGPAGPGADPNPFSRDGATPAGRPDAPEHGQGNPGATALPPAGVEPSGGPDPYGYPAADQPGVTPYGQPEASPYGQPSPDPYGQPSTNPYTQPSTNPYGQPIANPPYEQPPAYDQQPPYGASGYDQQPAYGAPGYDQSGYGVNPYQGGYGYPAYGAATPDHPQATAALITGIIGLALSLVTLGLGGLVGIAGVILGAKAKREIDADPTRYGGRSKANAGFITGIIGLAILLFWVIGFVALIGSR